MIRYSVLFCTILLYSVHVQGQDSLNQWAYKMAVISGDPSESVQKRFKVLLPSLSRMTGMDIQAVCDRLVVIHQGFKKTGTDY